MGGAASKPSSTELQDVEARLAPSGDLPFLRHTFALLSQHGPDLAVNSSKLQEIFDLVLPDVKGDFISGNSELSKLIKHLGEGIVDIYGEDNGKVDWLNFLKGYENCCRNSLGTLKMKLSLCLYQRVREKAQLPLNFSIKNTSLEFSPDDEIVGYLTLNDLQSFLWLFWSMDCWIACKEEINDCKLPDVEPLVRAAFLACSEKGIQESASIMDSLDDILGEKLPVGKLLPWIVLSIPSFSNCLPQYIQSKLREAGANIEGTQASGGGVSNLSMHRLLLTPGVAWATGLSLNDTRLRMSSFQLKGDTASLLFRSSTHGRGMNRFWAHVEGYRGRVFMLIQGKSSSNTEDTTTSVLKERKWMFGAIIAEGFENKESFYGSSSNCLFSLDPVFMPFHTAGKGVNFVYSHIRVPGSMYSTQPKPDGIAFGGEIGKERLWIDAEFSRLTIRHHSVDKTYQSGGLIPNQGYSTHKCEILEIEVWGLGGQAAEEQQIAFQKRENMFSEQRRKVDLKAFGNLAELPEKMMMDMLSDPQRVQREDR